MKEKRVKKHRCGIKCHFAHSNPDVMQSMTVGIDNQLAQGNESEMKARERNTRRGEQTSQTAYTHPIGSIRKACDKEKKLDVSRVPT